MESNSQALVARRRKRAAILAAGLVVVLGTIPAAILTVAAEHAGPPAVVVRVDDIQDFAFREAQLFLLNESAVNGVPLSLAIIAGAFGKDEEIAEAVKLAVSSGSEVAVHGWNHEDLAELSFGEQTTLLKQSKDRIREVLGVDTEVLVPPMFSFNEDTLAAMREEGYSVISASADRSLSGPVWTVMSIPATVHLSIYANGTWEMKSLDSVQAEVSRSIEKYGFAVIVTHPQEFIADGKLNPANTELYRALLRALKDDYSFKTLQELGQTWRQ